MRPHNFGAVSFGSPCGLLVIETCDRGIPLSDWIGLYLYPDVRAIAALDDLSCVEVSPVFTAHFGLA